MAVRTISKNSLRLFKSPELNLSGLLKIPLSINSLKKALNILLYICPNTL
jgi:hypothetical protein